MNLRPEQPATIPSDLLMSYRAELEARQHDRGTINFYLLVVAELRRVIEQRGVDLKTLTPTLAAELVLVPADGACGGRRTQPSWRGALPNISP